MNRIRIATVAAVAAAAALSLGACSSSSTPAASSAAPASSAAESASAEASPIGGDVLPPVIVATGQKTATASVGDAVVFSLDDPEGWTVESSDPAVLPVTPGGKSGDAMMNPGGVAAKAGEATVTLTPPPGGGEPWKVTVTVTEKSETGMLPPVMVDEGATEAAAKVGDTVVFNVSDPDAYGIESSDPTVLAVTRGGTQGTAVFNPGGVALKAGEATVTLTPMAGGGAPWTVKVTVS